MPGGSNVLEKVSTRADDAASAVGRPGPAGRSRRLPLDDLPGYLDADAEQLLIGVSVYREPADRNAVLFQVGLRDWTAARAPDRQGPAPPYQAPAGLAGMLAVCQASGLLVVAGSSGCAAAADDWHTVFVEAWLASELHRLLAAAGRSADLTDAHRRAAQYWQWRSAAWPQGRRADMHDLLEARHHLFDAGDSDQASVLTEAVCAQLHAWGDLGREAALIQETLDRLPTRSAGRAAWIHELGRIAEVRGDHGDAERLYQQALDIFATAGDRTGVSRSYHSLGVLAQAKGDYAKAEHRYLQSAEAAEQPAARAAAPSSPAARSGPAAAASPAADSHAADSHAADSPPADSPAADSPAADSPAVQAVRAPARPAAPPLAGDDLGLAARGSTARVTASRPAMTPVIVPRTAARTGGRTATRPGPPATSGHRHRPRWASRWRLPGLAAVALGVAVLSAEQVSGIFAGPPGPHSAAARTGSARTGRTGAGGAGTVGAVRRDTAVWVKHQVNRSAIVACDPAMCAALQAQGVPAGSLFALGPGSNDPLGANVVVATTAVRSQFGVRLAAVYAPVVVASFGTGSARIEVRVVAPDGSAAYLSALRSDLLARRRAGSQLLLNKQISVAGQARKQLADGLVDSRLLMTLAVLARMRPLRIVTFSGGPGASGEVPLPIVEITGSGHGTNTGHLEPLVTFLQAQRPPFLAASVRAEQLGNGHAALRIDFPDPGPLGLLTTGNNAIPISNRN
jgi:tetratricopeptide (TPR) repeat protein